MSENLTVVLLLLTNCTQLHSRVLCCSTDNPSSNQKEMDGMFGGGSMLAGIGPWSYQKIEVHDSIDRIL
jgi:hypothetical protein